MKNRKKNYEQMEGDDRTPTSDEAFQKGIQFPAKYIGTLDVPRPNSRVEIVAAMRRIRYEFKAKAIKKKKVTLTISTNGIRVGLRRKKKRKNWTFDDSRLTIMHHPVYRIFYVSHDSQDLKIFSYIARDSNTGSFKCNVFKAYKKSQAMRVVRTVGQAFEVCHKLGVAAHQRRKQRELQSAGDVREGEELYDGETELQASGDLPHTPAYAREDYPVYTPSGAPKTNSQELDLRLQRPLDLPEPVDTSSLPLTHTHTVQLLRAQLDQQVQHTQVALAQVQLLRDQLQAEETARVESQARTHQLLVHNRELLQHTSDLVKKLHELELRVTGQEQQQQEYDPAPVGDHGEEKAAMPSFESVEKVAKQSGLPPPPPQQYSNVLGEESDTPDSGHQEMSSESLTNKRAADSLWQSHTAAPPAATVDSELSQGLDSVTIRSEADPTPANRISVHRYDHSPCRDDIRTPPSLPPPPVSASSRSRPMHRSDLIRFEEDDV